MSSTAKIRNETCLVTMAGEFDRSNVDELTAKIESCLWDASSVVFDFGAVTFINGAVMGLLHSVLERLHEDGWMGVARPQPRIERLLGVAGFTQLPNFRIIPTLEEALKLIDGGGQPA